jgi:2-(1,2-epoxy-1,2-dihydrophenyl)acetyl-CoA isomerase
MSDLVLTELRDHIGILTHNDPEKRNALSVEMRLSVAKALREFMRDDGCRAIVLCGAGDTFCAGGDMKSAISNAEEPASVRTPRLLSMMHDIIRLIAEGSKPVIAAVDGHATGAGLSLAAACDYIVAGPTAKFCASFGRVGLVPDAGLLWSLPRRIGTTHARNLMLTAAAIDLETALRIGLADMAAMEGGNAFHRDRDRAQLHARGPAGGGAYQGIDERRSALARRGFRRRTAHPAATDGQRRLFGSAGGLW